MQNALFTIVIPWHGNFEHLARALGSLDDQTFRRFNILIVCNGAGLAARSEAENHFPQCHFINCDAANVSKARNMGADAATTDWVAFLDADDRFLPDKLTQMANAIASHDVRLISSRGLRVRSGGVKSVYPPQLLGANENAGEYFFSRGANFSGTATVARADLVRQVRYDETIRNYEDTEFIIRCQLAGAHMHMLSAPLFEWFDDREDGRLSRYADYENMLAWAENTLTRAILTEKAYFGFVSRRVAQHRFPHHFWWCLSAFYAGWQKGGIPLRETAIFMIRGMLPGWLAKSLLDLKVKRDARKMDSAPG